MGQFVLNHAAKVTLRWIVDVFFFLHVFVGDFYSLMICKTEWLRFFGEGRVDIIPDYLENKYILVNIDGFLLGLFDVLRVL